MIHLFKLKNLIKSFSLSVLCVMLALSTLSQVSGFGGVTVQAASTDKLLTLKQAKALAVANSDKIEKVEIQIDGKKAALTSAVKSIAVKQKNMRTFRWSPLIKFKFPTKPDLAEASEFQFKPIQIQYEIDKLEHKLTDIVIQEHETVNNLYVEIVVLEKSIEFNTDREEILSETLEKNKKRLLVGDADPSEVSDMEKALKKITQKLSTDKNQLISKKKKLGKKIGLDVTTGYRFQNPFTEAALERSILPDLINYTLDRDDNYYDVCIEETSNKVSTETNYKLMKNHYPSKYMNMISSYVDAILKGEKINSKAFYKQYKEFVGRVNEKWNGKKKILFFKFPKNWFQGEIDGDRFIEDDPYTLYANAMDYKDARLSRIQTADELSQQVEDTFDTYISVRNAYVSYVEQADEAGEALKKAKILNKAGELTYSEYKQQSDDYEELQNSMFDAMSTYSTTLYSYDRLTCGGITFYLGNLSAEYGVGGGGESYVIPEYVEGAQYYIKPIVQNNMFQFGVIIPEEFEIELSDYELWINGKLVVGRTPIAQSIRHLALDLDGVDRAFVRFYNDEEFIDDVDIDTDVYNGELKIVKAYNPKPTDKIVARYETYRSELRNQYELTIKPEPTEEAIAFYRVRNEKGKYLLGETPRPINKVFKYISVVNTSLGTLTFEFFDESQSMLYTGHVDIENQTIIQDTEAAQ